MPALVADTSLSGMRVSRELDTLIDARGKPAMIVSDNGTELTGMAILLGRKRAGSSAGKPQQNAFVEWKDDYNSVRPHSAIGNVPPAVYAILNDPAKQRDGSFELFEAPRPARHPVFDLPRWKSLHAQLHSYIAPVKKTGRNGSGP